MKIETFSAEETYALGKKLGSEAKPGDVLTLIGDLGVGKTVFTQGFADGLGITEPISSPTFTIVQEYDTQPKLLHFDAYRLADADELLAIGFTDYLCEDAILVMEWAELVESALPAQRLELTIEGSGDQARSVRALARGRAYERLLEQL